MNRRGADLVLTNGKIALMDQANRFVSALAAAGGRILAVGSDSEIADLITADTQVIDLDGKTAIPGIVDSHCHPDSAAARVAKWTDLSPARIRDKDALLETIRARAASLSKDEWFVGYRFNEQKSGGYPTREELDAAGQGRPVFILRTDAHLGLANAEAFRRCGIGSDSADPPFGQFDRDPATDRFTGLVRETATHVFLDHIHDQDTVEDLVAGFERVFDQLLSYGITSVYNSLTASKSIHAYQALRDRGGLNVRVGIIASGREDGLIEALIRTGIRSGFGDDWLRVIGVEWCPDCSTSGRTAAYYEPYQGAAIKGEPAANRGMLLYDFDTLRDRALAAHRAGLQVMIEGVGDRGIDFALDVIEACLKACPRDDHRMRVEHCCYVTPPILERLRRLEVIDSSATGFMYDLGDAYVANRGTAAMRYMWPHRSLIDAGVPAPGHSDSMVCQPNPFVALWSMVNRKSDTGTSLDDREAISVVEALRAYTWLGAYSGREEHRKGSLEPGKLADVAVLDRDLFTVAPDGIRDVRVETTIVDGVVRFVRTSA